MVDVLKNRRANQVPFTTWLEAEAVFNFLILYVNEYNSLKRALRHHLTKCFHVTLIFPYKKVTPQVHASFAHPLPFSFWTSGARDSRAMAQHPHCSYTVVLYSYIHI